MAPPENQAETENKNIDLQHQKKLIYSTQVKQALSRISAIGIKRLITSHPAVADDAVIGIPDKELGEKVCACIQLKEGACLVFEGLVLYLRSLGASVLQLSECMGILDAMPLTKVGKADKNVLNEKIAKKPGVN